MSLKPLLEFNGTTLIVSILLGASGAVRKSSSADVFLNYGP
jgi:hypothetical protein